VVNQRVRVEDDLLIGSRSRLPYGSALDRRVVDASRNLCREREGEERRNQGNGKAAHE